MKKIIALFGIIMGCVIMMSSKLVEEIWTPSQLMETKDLATLIEKNETKNTLIISVGPDAVVKGSINMGPTNDPENLAKFKNYLKDVKKNKQIVIYCGCCPFAKCPNIRPAFKMLTDLGFKNAKLLNVPHNIKTDWIDKDYPTED